jgi:hypothetical protein
MFDTQQPPAYLLKRHEEETAAATAATDRNARIAHLELALRYAVQAAKGGLSPKD